EAVKLEAWRDLFLHIGKVSKDKKTILVIDEFQRLKKIAPGFITELQNQWDSALKNNPLMIILVGSSIGMMRKIAMSPHGALYGRKTAQMQLEPFRYADFRQVFPGLTEAEKVEWYSVFGGTPAYLELARRQPTLMDAIKKVVLEKEAPLREEPKNLLEFELEVIARYNSILQAIARGKRTIREMSDETKIDQTTLPAYLNSLRNLLGLVRRKDPLFGKKNLGRYALADNFFSFWYSFVLPHASGIEIGNLEAPLAAIHRDLPAHVGRCVEEVVRELFILYNGREMKGVKLDFERIGAWWDRSGNEIDLVIDGKEELLLGEIKWTNKPMGADILYELEKKAALVPKAGKRQFVLVSRSGFEPACLKRAQEMGCLTLDIKDIEGLFDKA
ncbi:MAG: ATP-binding protein, partial [Candidatus Burarchaeum sp.]